MLVLSVTFDFTPFGGVHPSYHVYGLMTGLFAWISLTPLSRTYFLWHHCYIIIVFTLFVCIYMPTLPLSTYSNIQGMI